MRRGWGPVTLAELFTLWCTSYLEEAVFSVMPSNLQNRVSLSLQYVLYSLESVCVCAKARIWGSNQHLVIGNDGSHLNAGLPFQVTTTTFYTWLSSYFSSKHTMHCMVDNHFGCWMAWNNTPFNISESCFWTGEDEGLAISPVASIARSQFAKRRTLKYFANVFDPNVFISLLFKIFEISRPGPRANHNFPLSDNKNMLWWGSVSTEN